MFVHSGASMHGHEYSARGGSIPRRSPLMRSAFSTPIPRIASPHENTLPTIHHRPPLERPLSDNTPRPEPTVRFREPDQDTMSDDGRSVANSEGSGRTARGSKRRRSSVRTSTSFHLAHPAPTLTQKQRLLQIRPRLLLQLQRLSADSRPRPAIDVLPSTVVVPRLVKKFPRIFRGKGELGANDVMVVKSEEYDAVNEHKFDESDSDEEGVSNRDLMGVICQARKDSGGSAGKAEIVLSDGAVWEATPLPNGLYEFVNVDGSGEVTTARWVKRCTKQKSVDLSDPLAACHDFKFTFSIINPNSRRHPIIATITQNQLDIPDLYTSISTSSGKHPPCSPIRSLPGEYDDSFADSEPAIERTTNTVDEALKRLIQVTGIWVALRQGWSPYFRYNDSMTLPTVSSNPRISSHGRVRSVSLTPDTGRPSPAGTCSPESCHSAFKGKMHKCCLKGSPSSGISAQAESSSVPKRAVSTGTAFMQRAAARRAGNPPSTVASDSEGESVPTPGRITTEGVKPLANRNSTPPGSLHLPSSSATTPETPTRISRRIQSCYIPTSGLQNTFTPTKPSRQSTDLSDEKQTSSRGSVQKPKIGRWKAFTRLFHRTNSSSRT